MARGQRKPASDSLQAELTAARAPDTSTLSPPTVDGWEVLDEAGKKFFTDVWRSDVDRWTVGDLSMLAEAAFVHQQMRQNRMVCAMTPLLFELRNGVLTRHPVHVAQVEYSRQLQTLMRDLGVRSKDGFKPPQTVSPAEPSKHDADNVTDFGAFLNGD